MRLPDAQQCHPGDTQQQRCACFCTPLMASVMPHTQRSLAHTRSALPTKHKLFERKAMVRDNEYPSREVLALPPQVSNNGVAFKEAVTKDSWGPSRAHAICLTRAQIFLPSPCPQQRVLLSFSVDQAKC